MSVSDPLIKNLKVHALKLSQDAQGNGEITDAMPDFELFSEALEKILHKGCYGYCWDWLDELGHDMEIGIIEKSFSYTRAVETVRSCYKVRTPIGKLRLVIRCCLVNKCLHIPVEIMVRTYKERCWRWYDSNNSILGDDILGEIFLSVMLQCSMLRFKLDVNNARFLDNSLEIPKCVFIEFVPCESLGVAVSFIDDKALVVHVEQNGVAAEEDQIEVGDVIDELNGYVLGTEMRGKLNSIMSKCKNKPITVKLIKWWDELKSYSPILSLIKKANIDFPNIKLQLEMERKVETKLDRAPGALRGGQIVKYVGSLDIGKEGDVKQIEKAVTTVVSDSNNSNPIKARLECQELGLKVVEEASGKILFNNSFMEISSCGQTRKYPSHFAYIAGDDICNVARNFICRVFQSDNDNDIQTILQSIGQGFQRTHFAV